MNIVKFCNKVIEFSFYALFFLVPLIFTDKTSELFEFNKMWLTFAFTIIIGTAWFAKMVFQKQFFIQRTPLDIPIILFLLSQIVSTIFSLDTHISIWGYYSRFNGGLLSILSYVFLYYAFVSNLIRGCTTERVPDNAQSVGPKAHLGQALAGMKVVTGPPDYNEHGVKIVKRILLVSLFSGLVVALWGLPSHFGYDPTCFLFRGSLDVTCWTDAFQPKVRIFSTLGQPNWLAAYLAILIPIAIAFALSTKSKISNKITKPPSLRDHERAKQSSWRLHHKGTNFFEGSPRSARNNNILIGIWNLKFGIFFLFSILFYLGLLYTNSQSGYLGFLVSIIFLTIFILFINTKNKLSIFSGFAGQLSIFIVLFLLIAFFVGQPISALNKFSFPELLKSVNKQTAQSPKPAEPQGPALEVGGTNSGKIRLIVWKGAIDVWKNSPIFGTGVETFAFAYYKYRPAAHNLTSEWDYLYNKAHNEYLNYLATTGVFGLGSYLLMIGWFLFITFRQFKIQSRQSGTKLDKEKLLTANCNFELCTLNFALVASYLSILVSNFFGFSVVIVNLYFFLIPAFVLILSNRIKSEENNGTMEQWNNNHSQKQFNNKISGIQWIAISFVILISCFMLLVLFNYWNADKTYTLGNNLSKMEQYQEAYTKLHEAVDKRGDEPMFRDELAFNNAIFSTILINQKDTEDAKKVIEEAIETSNKNVIEHPNNIVIWKNRVRTFYTLSQIDPKYLRTALDAIIRAKELAPTDAKISYNLGVLYGQTGNTQKAIETLQETIKLKPDYRDAYFALGLFYHEEATNKDGKVTDSVLQKKAIDIMNFILTKFATNDAQVKQSLKTWGEK
ncbi:MAG: O-antigen ligase family protein [Candidatus Levybacteria bacterium]|nr:O-antigen ligase family protein [Candidatus Levybacteria bacterium]